MLVSVAQAATVDSDAFGRSTEKNLSRSPVWLALLHFTGDRSDISDSAFFLSSNGRRNPEAELKATLDFLYEGKPANVCRFPARYLWLKAELALPALPLEQCADLVEFIDKAPNHRMSLIFASESLTQPASMMGHSFFKITGQKTDGTVVSHAVTFFTEAEGYNLPKLFFESVVIGKPGFFALSPFQEDLSRYLSQEQRAVWEFDLDFDEAQLQLAQFHFQELKQTKLLYFFQSYNCATLLRHVLGLSGRLKSSISPWVTPKDVVKDAHRSLLVKQSSVHQPNAALVRAISDQLHPQTLEALANAVRTGDVDTTFFAGESDEHKLRLVMASAYADYLTQQDPSDLAARTSVDKLSLVQSQQSERPLTTSSHLNPQGHPPDSQITLSARSIAGKKKGLLSVLPASHLLMDDNRGYSQETELQLMKVTAYVDENRLGLDQLTVYKMQSLPIYSPLMGGLSTQTHIQWGSSPYDKSDSPKGWHMSAAFGRTHRLADDIDVFAMLGAGFGYFRSNATVPVTVEAGVIVREVANMKTTASYLRRRNLLGQALSSSRLTLDQSKYLSRRYSVFARWHRLHLKSERVTEFEVGMKYLF